MPNVVCLVVCFCLILASGADGRRHHKHGDPEKAGERRERRLQEPGEAGREEGDAAPTRTPGPTFGLGAEQLPGLEALIPARKTGLSRGGGRGGGKRHHQHHPVDASVSSVYKDQWKRITNYQKSEDDGCATLRCRRRQVCLVDLATGEAECVHRRVLRMKRKMKKAENQARKEKKKAKKHAKLKNTNSYFFHDEEQRIRDEEQRMKEHIERVKNFPEYHEKEQLMFQHQPKSSLNYIDRSASKKSEIHARKVNSALSVKPHKACTKEDMDEMGRRLLDWFKLLMDDDDHNADHPHHKSKRNSKKKELRDDDECICQAPVSWEFQQLDSDSSNQLTAGELRDIEDNGYEHCVRPFIDVCDHNHDLQLSQKEWCCCFADILPPCLGAQRRIPTEQRNGRSQVLVGAFVPTCDKDGFFEREQCHGSTGQCWCVDRNGHEIHTTRRQGAADCDKYTERYIQENI